MRGNYEELPCPFCDKGRITCWFIKGAWGEKRKTTSTFGKAKFVSKSSDVWIIKSGCSVCGKSQEEVEKELKKQGMI